MKRKQLTIAAVLAVAAIVAVGALLALRADRGEELRWTVIGTGVDGQTLRIWMPTVDSSCDEVRVEVNEDSLNRLEIEPRLYRQECGMGTDVGGAVETVRLTGTISGREIVGRGYDPTARLPSSATEVPQEGSARILRVPGVLGLRLSDATRLLQRAGYRVRVREDREPGTSVLPTDRIGYQEPPPETPAAGRWAPGPGKGRVRVVTLYPVPADAE